MLRTHARSLLLRTAASASTFARSAPAWAEAASVQDAHLSRAAAHTWSMDVRSWFGRQGISSSSAAFGKEGDDKDAPGPAEGEAVKPAAEGEEGAAAADDEKVAPSAEELQALLQEKEAKLGELEEQLAETKDRLVYTLADMENLRQRTARQAEDAKKFAVQGFVKSILDVADNLERAAKAVPEEVKDGSGGEELDAEAAKKMLLTMLEGVQLTEKVLLQIFQQNGIEKLEPLGDKFDPNLHQALFEMPDPSKEAGTIGAVTKAGYTLHGRVVRPADVGVVRAS